MTTQPSNFTGFTDDLMVTWISRKLRKWHVKAAWLDNTKMPSDEYIATRREEAQTILTHITTHHIQQIARLEARIAELEGRDEVREYIADGYFVGDAGGRVGLTVGETGCDGDNHMLVQFGDGTIEQISQQWLTPATRADVQAAGLDPDAGKILGEQE